MAKRNRLTQLDAGILSGIDRREKPGQIASTLRVSPSVVDRAVESFEKRGLVRSGATTTEGREALLHWWGVRPSWWG